jgi:cellobiose phosphorylase
VLTIPPIKQDTHANHEVAKNPINPYYDNHYCLFFKAGEQETSYTYARNSFITFKLAILDVANR